MNITPNIKIIDLSLYLKKQKALIISDVHIGYEEALNKKGYLVPRFQFKEVMKKLENILKNNKVETLIINGDLKHEFGTISETEWRHTLRLLDLANKYVKKIILIKGNHDKVLEPIAKKRDVEIVDKIEIEDMLIIHGNKLVEIDKKIKTIIIGHDHPALTLTDPPRSENYKCFLIGSYKRKKLIVMPSFFLVNEGTDVLKEELLSPFLNDIKKFRVIVVSDKLYDFGLIKKEVIKKIKR